MITRYYTVKEFGRLSTEEKLSFGAGNVRLVTFIRAGRRVTEWEVKIVRF